MAGIAGVMGAVGSIVGAMGSIAQANAAVAAAKAQQKQLNEIAAEKEAIATRQVYDQERQKRLALSRMQAVASASGGGATDPTVMELAGGIEQEAYVNRTGTLAQARTAANLDRYQGTVGVQTAKAEAQATTIGAIGGAISGVTSAFAKYGAPSLPSSTSYGAASASSGSIYGTGSGMLDPYYGMPRATSWG